MSCRRVQFDKRISGNAPPSGCALPLYFIIFSPSANKLPTNRRFSQIYRKIKNPSNCLFKGFCIGCGGRTRTYDLRVMSPTSYHLLHSAIFKHPQSECLIIIPQCNVFVNTFFLKSNKKVTVFIDNLRRFLGNIAVFEGISASAKSRGGGLFKNQ